jgi:HEAT repeat protein
MKNRVAICWFALAGLLPAQRAGEPELQKAILREEAERDDKAAAETYRALARNSEADSAVRVQAFERLARLARRTQAFAAQKEDLAALAKAIGAQAEKVLKEIEAQDEGLAAQADWLVSSPMFTGTNEQYEAQAKALKLIGGPAVPVLARHARHRYPGNLAMLGRYVDLIREIGGKEAGEFWREAARVEDVLFRRAVVTELVNATARAEASGTSVGLGPEARVFLRDPDDKVRRMALRVLASDLSFDELIRFLKDPSREVREGVRLRWHELRGEDFDTAAEMLGMLVDGEDAGARDAAIGQVLQVWGTASQGFGSARLNALFLKVLADGRPDVLLQNQVLSVESWATQRPEILLGLARKLGPTFNPAPSGRQTALCHFIVRSIRGWEADAMPAVLEMVDLGYAKARGFPDIHQWVVKVATKEHTAAIAKSIESFDVLFQTEILLRLAELGCLPAATGPLDAAIEKLWEWQEHDHQPAPGPNTYGAWNALLSIGTAEADAVALRRAAQSHHSYELASGAVRKANIRRLDLLRGLLTAEIRGKEEVNKHIRDGLFQYVAGLGLPELIDALPQAYARGLPGRSGERRGVMWLVDAPGSLPTNYDGEAIARIYELCHATGKSEFWTHALFQNLDPDKCPQALVSWYARRYSGIPAEHAAGKRWVVHLVLGATEDPGERDAMVKIAIESDEIGSQRAALQNFGSLTPAKEPLLRRCLASDDPIVCNHAVHVLLRERRDATVLDWLLPLANSENENLRLAIAEAAAQVPDRRWVPMLLTMLRDPNENVRKEAQESLEKLQFYFDQVERWERWQKNSPLQTSNAAEALLQQAAKDQPKSKRLVAIASLGTLGVAETLPLLIEWSSDPDPEIAKAAAEAVNRINQKGR